MTTLFSQGTFLVANGGTSDISIGSYGFAPVANQSIHFFWGCPIGSEGSATEGGGISLGAAVSTTEMVAIACYSRDVNQGTQQVKGILRDTMAYEVLTSGIAESGRFKIKSYNTNGITLSVGNAFAGAWIVNYACIHSADLVNSTITTKAVAAVSGATEAVTGMAFQPTWAIALHEGISLVALNTLTNQAGIGIGAYDGTNQVAAAAGSLGAGSANQNFSIVRTDCAVSIPRNDNASERIHCVVNGFNSDGLTYTVTRSAGAEAPQVAWILGKGTLPFRTDSFVCKTSTGTFSAMTPGGSQYNSGFLMTMTGGLALATQSSSSAPMQFSIGGAVSASARGSAWMTSPTAAQDVAQRQDSTRLVQNYARSATDTFGIVGDVDFSAWGSTIVLNQTTGDSAARLVPAFMFGSGSAVTAAFQHGGLTSPLVRIGD